MREQEAGLVGRDRDTQGKSDDSDLDSGDDERTPRRNVWAEKRIAAKKRATEGRSEDGEGGCGVYLRCIFLSIYLSCVACRISYERAHCTS